MPRVTAWHCPHTGKLFLHQSEYTTHLAKLAKKRATARKLAKVRREFDKTIRDFQMSCFEFEDIERWIMANTEVLFTQVDNFHRRDHRGKLRECPKITEFRLINMRYNVLCSNTHAAPKGKKTNWGGHESPEVPRGYPGWRGSVEYRTSDFMAWDSRAWKAAGIHTGSGGGGEMS
ncbi:MAG: hypothetical protein EOP84_20750, partial [Verrucomicrobiaceae bacterium]